MIRSLLRTIGVLPRPLPLVPDRMCGAYGLLMRELFAVIPHRLTRLDVQHLLYTAQVLAIARDGRPLFENQFVATSSGPVLPSLWRLQRTRAGLDQVMDPIHQDPIDATDRETIAHVAARLGRLSSEQIAVYANSADSAARRVFLAQARDSGRKGPDRNETGTIGTMPIALADLEAEVVRRYPADRNAIARRDSMQNGIAA